MTLSLGCGQRINHVLQYIGLFPVDTQTFYFYFWITEGSINANAFPKKKKCVY